MGRPVMYLKCQILIIDTTNEYIKKKDGMINCCDGMVNLRYVDDILPAFDNEQDSLNFFGFLNKRHPGIKFTIEK